MKADQSRSDLLLGAAVLTIALVLSHVLSLPLYLFAPLVIVGVVLMAEAIWTNHTFQTSMRMERTYDAQRKAPVVIQAKPDWKDDAWKLMQEWSQGKPTTRRHAETLGVNRERWEQIIRFAERAHLGHLEQAQGGNLVLRWTAPSFDAAVSALGRLG